MAPRSFDPVSGDKELVQALRILGRGLRPSDLDKAMRVASTPMVKDAKERARKHRQPGKRPKGGHVDEGIVFRRSARSRPRDREYVIGGINRARFLLTWLELGTSRHWQPNRFGGIWHPGARAFPTLRPSLDANEDTLFPIFTREIWKSVQRMVHTLPKGRR